MSTENIVSRVFGLVFQSSPRLERGLVIFRLVASPVLGLMAFLTRDRLPYWEFAFAGFAAVLAVNVLLLWLLKRNRYMTVAVAGTSVDTALLLALSSLIIRASASAASTSEFWLIYPLVIIASAYRFRQTFCILYTLLLSLWYGTHIALFFSPTSRPHVELPVRIGFFLLIGALAAIMSQALRHESRG